MSKAAPEDSSKRPPRPAAASIGRLAALLASILCGVAAALLAMPWMFRHTPTDVSRIGFLLDALRDPSARPRIVVLGSSVVMSGVDTRILSESIEGEPPSWNLATVDQTLIESYLLTQELPDSVRTAIYAVPLHSGALGPALDGQKYNTFYMFGFRPTEITRTTLLEIHPSLATLLDRSHLSQLFTARWALRQLPDTQLRTLLRTDLTLAAADRDLFHPQRYARRVAPDVLERLMASQRQARKDHEPRFRPGTAELLVQIAEQSALAGRSPHFVLMPIHPRLRAPIAERAALVELSTSSGLTGRLGVHDLSDLLDESEFIDDLHPTNEGAAKLTRRLAELIRS